jgi:PAS domain S-box-containing protein
MTTLAVRAAPRTGAEEALRRIVEGTAAATGRDFFRSLTRHLAGALGFRYALVGELISPKPARIRTLAVWTGDPQDPRGGRFADGFDYLLANTPGDYVVGKKPCHFPQAVRHLFPEDAVLERFGVESYVGVPLFDAAHRPVGLLALMGERPTASHEAPQVQSILKLFAPRAAAELERQRKEAGLRENGQRYQVLAETSPVGIFHTDPDGNFTYVNARCCQIMGLRAEQAFGDGWARNVHPDDRRRVLAAVAAGVNGPFHTEFRFVHHDGRVIWVVTQVVPLRAEARAEPGGEAAGPGELTGYLGTITDITETKRAEEELRRSEQRYQALAENSAVGIWQVRLDGATLYINPTMRAMLELGADEDLTGVHFHSFFSPEGLAVARAEHKKRALGVASNYEVELVGRRGGLRNVVISGAPIVGAGGEVESMIGTFTDITQRRRAEEALRESERSLRENEARLRLLVEQVPTILWTTDPHIRFTSLTGAALPSMGMKPSEGLGLTLGAVFGFADDSPALHAHRRALEGVPSTYEQDWEGRTFQAHVEPLRGPDGAVTGAIGVAADVTDRKRVEQVLRESRDALEARVQQRTAELLEANRAMQHEVMERRAAEEALRQSELSLRQSEQRYASILNTQQTLVSRSDTSGRITYVNAAHARTFGSKVGDSLLAKVHPDDIEPTSHAMEALGRPPYTCTLEQRCEVDGQWRTFLWQVGVIRGEDGKIIEYQGVGFDITERRRAEEAMRESERRARESAEQARDAAVRAKEAAEFNRRLVLEVDHRVRNNLAGLLSLVTAMRSAAGDVDSFAGAIEGRLLAMVHVHQLLAETGWRSVDLRTLVRTLLKAVERLAPHAVPVEVEGPPVAASPRQALPLSMILLEWFTNSSKYGAHSRLTGRVSVEWERLAGQGDGQNERVRLHWRESGGPRLADLAPATSLGTDLVKGFATLELRGRYEPRFLREGAEHVLEFPVRERDQEPAGLVYGGQGNAGSVAGSAQGLGGAAAAAAIEEEGAPGRLGEPLSEPDEAASPVRSRPTRRR